MESREDPAPGPQAGPQHPIQSKPTTEPASPGVPVRVSIVDEHRDEEEKEAGYGHGV